MDAVLVHNTGTTEIPVRAIKRKATSTVGESAKRFRANQTATDFDSDASDYNFESSSDFNDDYRITSSVATPLTPISPKASPRHPSDLLKIHRCTYEGCDKSFNRPAKLAQHFRSHTNTRPFRCPHPLCTKDFLRESHLKHHVKSAHSEVRDYVCDWEGCGKGFVTATRLNRHHAAHRGRERFRCTIAGCGQAFRKHGTLQKHILIVHEGRKPFVCQVLVVDGVECGAGFDTEGQLNSHAGRIHESNNFICVVCLPEGRSTIASPSLNNGQASFSTYAALREHIESEHPPACTQCGQNCESLPDLKSHLEVIHGVFDINDSKAHFCHEQGCERGFTKKGNLRMHLQISHSKNRFTCGGTDPSTLNQVLDCDSTNSCAKNLTTKASLEERVRTAHQSLAPSSEKKKRIKHGVFDEQARKNQLSVLTRLTGAGYEEESGRTIPCLVTGCNHRFLREYDLEIHLQCRHGVADPGIQEMIMDPGGVYSRQTLQGTSIFATKEEIDAERALEMHFHGDVGVIGHEDPLGAGASRGCTSWVEEQSYQNGVANDEWLRDELEMRCLIGGDLITERHELFGGQDEDSLDPALQ